MIRSDAFPNRYLNQNNLPQPPGSTHTVIEDVRIETMSDEKKGEKPVMYFSVGTCIDTGKPLTPMVVNGGNWDEFEKFYGVNSDNWRGKTVERHVRRQANRWHPHPHQQQQQPDHDVAASTRCLRPGRRDQGRTGG